MTHVLDLALSAAMTLHLLTVGVAGWAPLACVLLERSATRCSATRCSATRCRATRCRATRGSATRDGDDLAGSLSRRLAGQSMWLLAIGMVLGGMVIGLLAARHGAAYFERYRVVPESRLWFGMAELAFFFLCMAVYRGGWDWFAGARLWHRVLAVVAASDLLYHFPPLFTVVATLAARPGLETTTTSFIRLLAEPEILARIAHHLLASLAATGIYVGWLAWREADTAAAESDATNATHRKESAARVAAAAGRWGLLAICLQLPVGAYLVVVLPRLQRGTLLGGDPLAAILFAASLLTALGLLHHLAAVAMGGAGLAEVRRCGILLAVAVLLMVGVRQRTRVEVTHGAQILRNDSTSAAAVLPN